MWGALRNAAAIASRAVEETTKQANELLDKLDGAVLEENHDDDESGDCENKFTGENDEVKEPLTHIVEKVDQKNDNSIKNADNFMIENIEHFKENQDEIQSFSTSRIQEEDFEIKMGSMVNLLQITQKELYEKSAEVKNLEIEISSIANKDSKIINSYQEEVLMLKERLAAAENNIIDLSNYLRTSEEEIQKRDTLIDELNNKYNKTREEFLQLESSNEDNNKNIVTSDKIIELQIAYSKLEEEMHSSQTQSSHTILQLEGQIKTLQSNIVSNSHLIAIKDEEIASCKESTFVELQQLQLTNNNIIMNLEDIVNQVKQERISIEEILRGQLKELEDDVKKHENRYFHLQHQYELQSTQVIQITDEYHLVKDALELAEKKIEEFSQRNDFLNSTKETLQSELKKIEEIHLQLKTEFDIHKQSYTNLLNQSINSQTIWDEEKSRLDDTIDSLSSERNTLVAEKESTMQYLQEHLVSEKNAWESQCQVLIAENKILQEKEAAASHLASGGGDGGDGGGAGVERGLGKEEIVDMKKNRKELRLLREKLTVEAEEKQRELQCQIDELQKKLKVAEDSVASLSLTEASASASSSKTSAMIPAAAIASHPSKSAAAVRKDVNNMRDQLLVIKSSRDELSLEVTKALESMSSQITEAASLLGRTILPSTTTASASSPTGNTAGIPTAPGFKPPGDNLTTATETTDLPTTAPRSPGPGPGPWQEKGEVVQPYQTEGSTTTYSLLEGQQPPPAITVTDDIPVSDGATEATEVSVPFIMTTEHTSLSESTSNSNNNINNNESVTSLQLKVKSLEKTISKAKTSRSNMTAQIQSLIEEKEALTNQISDLQNSFANITAEKDILEIKLVEEKEKNDNLSNQLNTMHEECTNSRLKNDVLASEILTLKSDVDQSTVKHSQLYKIIEELQSEKSILDSELQKLRWQCDDSLSSVESLTVDNAALTTRVDGCQEEIGRLTAQLQQKEGQLRLMETMVPDLQATNSELLLQLSNSRQDLERSQCEVSDLTTANSQLSDVSASQQSEKERVVGELLAAEEKIKQLEVAVKVVSHKEEALIALKQQLQEAQQSYQMAIESSQLLHLQLSDNQAIIEELKNTLSITSTQLQVQETVTADLQQELASAKESRAALHEDLQCQRDHFEQSQIELQKRMAEIAQQSEQLNAVITDNSKYKVIIDVQLEEIKNLKLTEKNLLTSVEQITEDFSAKLSALESRLLVEQRLSASQSDELHAAVAAGQATALRVTELQELWELAKAATAAATNRALAAESAVSRMEDKKKKDLEYLKRQNDQIADLQRSFAAKEESLLDSLEEARKELLTAKEERESQLLEITGLRDALTAKEEELMELERQLPSLSLSPSLAATVTSSSASVVIQPDRSEHLATSTTSSSSSNNEAASSNGSDDSFVVVSAVSPVRGKGDPDIDLSDDSGFSKTMTMDEEAGGGSHIGRMPSIRLDDLRLELEDLQKELKKSQLVTQELRGKLRDSEDNRRLQEANQTKIWKQFEGKIASMEQEKLSLIQEAASLEQALEEATTSATASKQWKQASVSTSPWIDKGGDIEKGGSGSSSSGMNSIRRNLAATSMIDKDSTSNNDNEEDEEEELYLSKKGGVGLHPLVVQLWNVIGSTCPSLLCIVGERPPRCGCIGQLLVLYFIAIHMFIGWQWSGCKREENNS